MDSGSELEDAALEDGLLESSSSEEPEDGNDEFGGDSEDSGDAEAADELPVETKSRKLDKARSACNAFILMCDCT